MASDAHLGTPPGARGVSERLREFTEQFPYERRPLLDFVIGVAATTPPGARVLDLGSGNAPYRELFGHADYRTSDWAESVHPGAASADIIGPADALPVPDGAFELVICTQVLEHVPDPAAVLAEVWRILSPGGRIAITVPLLWEEHEMPHDYFRYTSAGLRHLLLAASFAEPVIVPRGNGFTALAQLMRNLAWGTGEAADGLGDVRKGARELLLELSDQIAALAPLDARGAMALGFDALATRPR